MPVVGRVQVNLRLDEALVARIDKACPAGTSRNEHLISLIERALSDPKGTKKTEQASPGSVSSRKEGVRLAASARQGPGGLCPDHGSYIRPGSRCPTPGCRRTAA